MNIISSVRVYRDSGLEHAVVAVWNRGGKAGELTVSSDDAATIASRLFGDRPTVVSLASDARAYDLWEVDE